jgi:hypothetical protein
MNNKNFILLYCLIPFISFASDKNTSKGEIYRYQSEGVTIYGDKIPNQSNIRVDSISRRTGIVTSTKRYSDEEIIEIQKKYELERKEQLRAEDERRKNLALLSKYSTEQEIEIKKNIEIDRISEIIQKDIANQVQLEDSISKLKKILEKNPDDKKVESEYKKQNWELNLIQENIERTKKLYNEKLVMYTDDKVRFKKIMQEKILQ